MNMMRRRVAAGCSRSERYDARLAAAGFSMTSNSATCKVSAPNATSARAEVRAELIAAISLGLVGLASHSRDASQEAAAALPGARGVRDPQPEWRAPSHPAPAGARDLHSRELADLDLRVWRPRPRTAHAAWRRARGAGGAVNRRYLSSLLPETPNTTRSDVAGPVRLAGCPVGGELRHRTVRGDAA